MLTRRGQEKTNVERETWNIRSGNRIVRQEGLFDESSVICVPLEMFIEVKFELPEKVPVESFSGCRLSQVMVRLLPASSWKHTAVTTS